jgi:hypothetical protein
MCVYKYKGKFSNRSDLLDDVEFPYKWIIWAVKQEGDPYWK